MKRIFILGSSVAGVKAAEEIRMSDKESEITIMSFDGMFPYDKSLFSEYISKEKKQEDLFCKDESFYKDNNINVIVDKNITRVNLKRNRIYTDDRSQFEFDVLIITGAPTAKLPDIKGTSRTGVYSSHDLNVANEIVKNFVFVDTVTFQCSRFSELFIALSVAKEGKECFVAIPPQSPVSFCSEIELCDYLDAYFAEKNIRIMWNNEISEILGDSDVKAVRLSSGKVVSSEMVVFLDAPCDVKLFTDNPIEMDNKIFVNSSLRSNLENVFVLDAVNNLEFPDSASRSMLEEQGAVAGKNIKGEEEELSKELYKNHVKIDDLSFDLIGEISVNDGIVSMHHFNSEDNTYIKLFIRDSNIIGAIFLNGDKQKVKIERVIEEKLSVSGFEDAVLDENIDFDALMRLKGQDNSLNNNYNNIKDDVEYSSGDENLSEIESAEDNTADDASGEVESSNKEVQTG